MDRRVLLTMDGAEKLHNELNHLISSERVKIIKAIAEARAHGDLKENAEYHAAKEKQSFIEGRIQELQAKLSVAEIIDPSKTKNQQIASFGAKVSIADLADKHYQYTIVGEDESNIKQGKIAYTSPIAKALLGSRVDDEVIVKTPNGEVSYEVVAISY